MMIELPVIDKTGKKVDTIQIDEASLGSEVRPTLLKQAYVMFHANRRIGSARTKSRGMVEGSTRKLYRQKGTGNARVGNARTVVRKGGGVAFAKTADTGKFRQRMPKRMRRLANRNALLAKLVDSEVKCIDSLDMTEPKTRDLKGTLEAVGIDRPAWWRCLPTTATRPCPHATSRTWTPSESISSMLSSCSITATSSSTEPHLRRSSTVRVSVMTTRRLHDACN